MFNFDLGIHVKDVITGIKGIVTGRADYITGCNQYLIQQIEKNKKLDAYWFDENRLIETKGKKIVLETGNGINDNGACEDAPIK